MPVIPPSPARYFAVYRPPGTKYVEATVSGFNAASIAKACMNADTLFEAEFGRKADLSLTVFEVINFRGDTHVGMYEIPEEQKVKRAETMRSRLMKP